MAQMRGILHLPPRKSSFLLERVFLNYSEMLDFNLINEYNLQTKHLN